MSRRPAGSAPALSGERVRADETTTILLRENRAMDHYEVEYMRTSQDHVDVYGEIDGDKAKALALGLAAGLTAGDGGCVAVFDVRPVAVGNMECRVREVGRYVRNANGDLIGSGEYEDGAKMDVWLDSIYSHLGNNHTEPCRCGLWQHQYIDLPGDGYTEV